VRWAVERRATLGDWWAVEGTLTGHSHGRRFSTRFSTWFRFRCGRIVHQIDYVDYATIRRQTAAPR
jgi:hypothetical protein